MSSTSQPPAECDVVVIGSGVLGAAIAYNLVETGVNVTLVERGDFCGEASGANIGLVTTTSKPPGVLLDLGRRSVELYASLDDTLGRNVHFQQLGSMIVATTPEGLAQRQDLTRRQQEVGVEVYDLSGDEARQMEPTLPDSVLGASYCPNDGTVYPFTVVAAYLHRAIELGMNFVPRTEVTGIEVANGRVQAVETTRGRIRTETVVNAAGAWAGHVAEMAGLEIPIIPVRGQVLVTEPLAGLPDRVILGLDPSIRKTWAANGLIGSSVEPGEFEKRTSLDVIRRYATGLTEMYPYLQDIQVLRGWSGVRPSTPDEMMVLGPSQRVGGFVIAGGTFRNGMLYGPAVGEVICDVVLGREPAIDISEARPERFDEAPSPATIQH